MSDLARLIAALLIVITAALIAAPRPSPQPAGFPVETMPAASSPTPSVGARDPGGFPRAGAIAGTRTGAPGSQAVERARLGATATTRPGPRPSATPSRKASPKPQRVSGQGPSPRPSRARPAGSVQPAGRLSGVASWYCSARSACTRGYGPGCLCAAAGPAIRAALGSWRGRYVTVSTVRASVTVRLVDFCACGDRLLDLYSYPFSGLAPLSAGLVSIRILW